MNGPVALTQRTILGALAALAVIAGSLGPWRTIGPIKASGTEITGDADLMVIAGIVCLVLVLIDRSTWSVLILGALVAAAGIYDAPQMADVEVFGRAASVGWGLILAIAGGVGLVVWSIVDLRSQGFGATNAKTPPAGAEGVHDAAMSDRRG